MNPKVSILVPVYNVSRFIEKCAQTLFEQTFESIEYVFVDDCSTDNSIYLLQNLIDKYPNRLSQTKIINHEKNCGIGETRNTLMKSSEGEFMMWVDSDDYLSLNAVELLYNKAVEENADIVTTENYFVLKSNENIETVSQHFPQNNEEYIHSLASRKVRAALWGTLSKRKLWIENQISIPAGINFGEDYYATVKLFYFSKKINVVNKPIYYYNQQNISSFTTGRKSEKHFLSVIRLFDLLDEFLKKQNDYQTYVDFVVTARLIERNSLLLHSSRYLRQKYSYLYLDDAKYLNCKTLPFNSLQCFILNLINNRLFFLSEISIIFAKILRTIFKVRF